MKAYFRKSVIFLFATGIIGSASPAHALRTEATQSSAILAELRSELRSGAAVYDYTGIRDPQVRNLIDRREKDARDVLNRHDFKILFSGFDMNETTNLAAPQIHFLMQGIFMDDFFKAALPISKGDVTIPVIRETPEEAGKIDFRNLQKHPWLERLKISPKRASIKAVVFFQETDDDTFHVFEVDGKPYKAPVRVPLWTFPEGILAVNIDYLASDPSIFPYELQSVFAIPPVLFHWDLVSPPPQVRPDAGLAYSYDAIQDKVLKKSMRREELDIREVLMSGVSEILVKKFDLRYSEAEEIANILKQVVLEHLGTAEGIKKIRMMLEKDAGKARYEKNMNKIGKILNSDWETSLKNAAGFRVYVSRLGSDSARKRNNRYFFTKFMTDFLHARDFFRAPSVFVKKHVSIPVMKLTPQDIADRGKTLDLENLWRGKGRVPVTALLFYEEPDEEETRFPYLQIRLEGKIYTMPKSVPLWTFPDGVLAVNITDIQYNINSVYEALGMALRRFPNRSEMRMAAGIDPKTLQIPSIPLIPRSKALGARSAFGIQAQDAYVIDSKLIRTHYDLAVLLAVLNTSPFVVLTENGATAEMRLLEGINQKLPDSGKIAMANSMDEALLLLNRQKAALMRGPATSRMNYSQTRILVSDQFSLDALALKKQVGDHAIVKVFSLDQFSRIAFGIVNRLEITDFAEELHQRILSQTLTAESA